MSDHVYKVVELVGSSTSSIEDAIQTAIKRADQTLRNLHWFEVVQTRGHVENGEVQHYQVVLKAGFTLEGEYPSRSVAGAFVLPRNAMVLTQSSHAFFFLQRKGGRERLLQDPVTDHALHAPDSAGHVIHLILEDRHIRHDLNRRLRRKRQREVVPQFMQQSRDGRVVVAQPLQVRIQHV
jgi:flavin-binding protein dodecin